VVVQACNPSTQEIEARGQPGLHSKLKDSLGLQESISKEKKKEKERKGINRARLLNFQIKLNPLWKVQACVTVSESITWAQRHRNRVVRYIASE
jgi:hypothetical protein